ncbi:MAG: TRAP transporter substrate-binding protein DctP [Desulfatibacillaceae bacterium]
MKSTSRACLLALATVLSLVFTLPALAQEEKKFTWRFASMAPEGVAWAKRIREHVLPAVEDVTEGNLQVKVFWGGVLGEDADYIEKMEKGILEGAGLSGRGVILAVRETAVLQLPFLFRSYDEVDYVKDIMRPTFDRIAKSNGFYVVGWLDQDFDYVYSTKWDKEFRDLSRLTFVSWFGPLEQAVLDSMGVDVVLSEVDEAAPALRHGRADSGIAPAAYILGAQLYSVVRYVIPMNIRYSPSWTMVRADVWADFPEKYRRRVHEIRDGVEKKVARAVRQDNVDALQSMLDYGVKKVELGSDTLRDVQMRTRTVWYDMAGDMYPRELLDEILAHLAEYRSNKGAE